jgi:hypothetical protein
LSMICSMMVCRSMMQSSFYGSWMPNDASASCVISSVLALRNIEASQHFQGHHEQRLKPLLFEYYRGVTWSYTMWSYVVCCRILYHISY